MCVQAPQLHQLVETLKFGEAVPLEPDGAHAGVLLQIFNLGVALVVKVELIIDLSCVVAAVLLAQHAQLLGCDPRLPVFRVRIVLGAHHCLAL